MQLSRAAWVPSPPLLHLVSLVAIFGCWSRGLEGLQTVKIGALLAYDSPIGEVALRALQLAVQDVNANSSILPNHELVLQSIDTSCDSFQGDAAAVQLLQEEVVAVAGPQTSAVAQFVSDLGEATRVPFVSFAATEPKLTMVANSYFLRTVHHDALQMQTLASLVALYKWAEVIAVTTNDNWGLNGVDALSDYLSSLNVNLVSVATLSPSANATDIETVLRDLALLECRVVVVHLQLSLGRRFFNATQSLFPDESNYVWLMSEAMSSLLEDFASTDSVWSALQGVVGVRSYIPPSPNLASFEQRWETDQQARNSSGNGTQSAGYPLNVYGLHAYDTAWMIARAIDTYFNAGRNFTFTSRTALPVTGGGGTELGSLKILQDGDSFLEIIKDTKFQGLTGHIELDSRGDLVGSVYEILNLVGKGSRTVGYWNRIYGFSPVLNISITSDNSSDSTRIPSVVGLQDRTQLQDIIWPTGYAQVPRGWAVAKNGKALLVGVPRKVGFAAVVSVTSDSRNQTLYQGFVIDVFEALVAYLPYQLNYTYVPIGNGIETPSYDDYVQEVADGKIDIAVGDIAITTSRSAIVDFTQPYTGSGLVVLVKIQRAGSSNAWSFLRPFTPLMWSVTGGFFFFTGLAVWILEHKKNPVFQGTPRKQLVTMLWYIFSTLFFAQREKTKSTLGRAVVIIWLFVVLIITSSYTASLTSLLTVEQLVTNVQGISGLLATDLKIGFQAGSYVEGYLKELNVPNYRLVPLNDQPAYAVALTTGEVGAVVDELPYVELFLAGKCGFTIAGSEFTKGGWGFALPKGSRLTADMSTTILEMAENGRLQHIHDYWLTSEDCNSSGLTVDANRLDLNTFWGLFAITGGASLLCIILYYVRLFFVHRKIYVEDPESNQSSISKHKTFLRSFVSFVAEPENGPNDSGTARAATLSRKYTTGTNKKSPDAGHVGDSRLDSQITREEA